MWHTAAIITHQRHWWLEQAPWVQRLHSRRHKRPFWSKGTNSWYVAGKRGSCTAAASTAFARPCITQLLSNEEHLLKTMRLGITVLEILWSSTFPSVNQCLVDSFILSCWEHSSKATKDLGPCIFSVYAQIKHHFLAYINIQVSQTNTLKLTFSLLLDRLSTNQKQPLLNAFSFSNAEAVIMLL